MRVAVAAVLATGLTALVFLAGSVTTPAHARSAERPVKDVTLYVADLRKAGKLAKSAAGSTAALGSGGAQVCARVGPAATRLTDAAAAAEAVLRRYQNARTRYGTREEIELLGTLSADLLAARKNLAKAAGGGSAPSAAEQQAAQRQVSLFQALIAKKVSDRLQIEGLQDVLLSTSFKEVKETVAAEVGRRIQTRAEAELRKLVGLRIKLDVPLKVQIHDFLEGELSRFLSKLVVSAGPVGIIISIVGGRIFNPGQLVRLVGAKLKEALRPKRNLDARTRRSTNGLEQLRRDLNALTPDSPLNKVISTAERARRELGRTNFLEGDLKRAGKSDLLRDLLTAKKNLERTIKLARVRFLLDSELVDFDFRAAIAQSQKAGADAAAIAKKLGCDKAPPPQPAGDACKENWWSGTWNRVEHGGQAMFTQSGRSISSGSYTWFGGGKFAGMKLSNDCKTMTGTSPKTKQLNAAAFTIELQSTDLFTGKWRWATTPAGSWNGNFGGRKVP